VSEARARPPYARVVRGRERYLVRTRLVEPLRAITLGLAARTLRALAARRAIPAPADVRRLLVIHRMRIGDAVVITPLLRALRERFPRAELVLLIGPLVEDLFRRDETIDKLVVFAPRPGERTDAAAGRAAAGTGPAEMAFVLDFTRLSIRIARAAGASVRIGYDDHGRGLGLTHALPWPVEWNRATADYPEGCAPRHQAERWLALGALAGAHARDAQPALASDGARDLRSGAGIPDGARILLLHPGSDSSKRWPAERWAAVADALADRHELTPVLSGGRADAAVLAALRAGMKRAAPDIVEGGLEAAVDVAARARLVITLDTSLSHIASAVGTPAVVLFGPGDPAIWRPYGAKHRVVRDPRGRCGGCKLPRCPLAEHLCMDGIAVEDVLRAAEEILARMDPS
jgi:heptosyltransferase-2